MFGFLGHRTSEFNHNSQIELFNRYILFWGCKSNFRTSYGDESSIRDLTSDVRIRTERRSWNFAKNTSVRHWDKATLLQHDSGLRNAYCHESRSGVSRLRITKKVTTVAEALLPTINTFNSYIFHVQFSVECDSWYWSLKYRTLSPK